MKVANAKSERDAEVAAQVDEIFDEFDADNNGTVDASEMKALIASDPDFVSLLFSGSHVMKAASAEEQACVIQRNFSDREFTRDELREMISGLAEKGLESPKRKQSSPRRSAV